MPACWQKPRKKASPRISAPPTRPRDPTPVTSGPGLPWLQIDTEGLLAASAGVGGQITAAAAGYTGIPAGAVDTAGLTSVVVAGMGGSAVAGEVLQAYAASRASIPVVLVNSASAPRFVGASSLVFAVSFSGHTEETLAVATTALSSGAPVVALTGGGPLAQLVAAGGGTVMALTGGLNPGVSQPRLAVGATVSTLLLACEQLGLLSGVSVELTQSSRQLELPRRSLSDGAGVAAEIARRLGRTIPVFHGSAGLA